MRESVGHRGQGQVASNRVSSASAACEQGGDRLAVVQRPECGDRGLADRDRGIVEQRRGSGRSAPSN